MVTGTKHISWKPIVVLSVSLSLLVYGTWRTSKARNSIRDRDTDKTLATRESIERAEMFEVVSFRQLNDLARSTDQSDLTSQQKVIDSIESTLQAAKIYNLAVVDDVAVQSLLRTASEFIYYRFVRDNPEDYIAWRLERGDRFIDHETLYGEYQIAWDYEFFFHDVLADDAPIRETFITFFTHQRSLWGEHYTPVGYAIDPESVLVLIETEDPLIGSQGVDLGNPDLNKFWFETAGGANRSWFTRGTDIRQQLMNSSLEKYQVGSVGFVLEFADGERRTVTLPMVRPLDGGKWSVEFLGTTDLDNSGGLIEF